MRREFKKIITELVEKDPKVIPITLDGGYEIFHDLIEKNPNRYWNFGVTEQASIGIAAGMALEGLKPYVYSTTPFLLERPFEQIKLDIVEQKADVKLVGYWNYPADGPTHVTKNVKGLCEILGIRLFEPKNSAEAREMFLKTYQDREPAFFYLTKDKSF